MKNKIMNKLIIFSKYPEPGKSKTRLIKALGNEKSSYIHKLLAERTFKIALNVKSLLNIDIEIHYSGGNASLWKKWLNNSIKIKAQIKGDLGQKMSFSFKNAFEKGFEKVVLIGTDCPPLCETDLVESFNRLNNNNLVLGPAVDGGYYLIGLTKFNSILFNNIKWGKSDVLNKTLSNAKKKWIKYSLLRLLFDIDRPEDLVFIKDFLYQNGLSTNIPIISIIIPTFNEEKIIENTLKKLPFSQYIEIIIADGGSTDKTITIAKSLGVKVINCGKGRANQMNMGAEKAKGEILLFLHCDTYLPFYFEKDIVFCLSSSKVSGGAFQLGISGHNFGLRIIELLANFRSKKLTSPYGDQCIFMKSETFKKIGGYDNIPIFEDVKIIDSLKKIGKVVTLDNYAITSDRRWKYNGVLRTTIINQLMLVGYYSGISLDNLASFYKRSKNERKFYFF